MHACRHQASPDPIALPLCSSLAAPLHVSHRGHARLQPDPVVLQCCQLIPAAAPCWLARLHAQSRANSNSNGAACAPAGEPRKGQKRGRDGGGDASRWLRREGWCGGQQQFTKFVLFKENMDTQGAIALLARFLHCKPATFGFAGEAEQVLCACQHVCVGVVGVGGVGAPCRHVPLMRVCMCV